MNQGMNSSFLIMCPWVSEKAVTEWSKVKRGYKCRNMDVY